MMNLNFNAATVAPQQAFEPLESGWYIASITGAEEKATNAGTGSYLKLEFTIVSENGKGRKVWTNLNLNNPNPKAVEIAYQQLSAICHAVGVMQLNNIQQVYNMPMGIKLTIRKQEGYEPSNEIKGFKAANLVPANHLVAQAAPAPQGFAPQNAAPVAPQQFVQQQAPAQQWQQPAAQQPAAAPAWQQQAAAPAPQGVAQQPAWANGAPQQGAAPAAAQAAAPATPAPEITTTQQPATDTAGQQAASAGTPPWMQAQQ